MSPWEGRCAVAGRGISGEDGHHLPALPEMRQDRFGPQGEAMHALRRRAGAAVDVGICMATNATYLAACVGSMLLMVLRLTERLAGLLSAPPLHP
jgi:hypothetical protein